MTGRRYNQLNYDPVEIIQPTVQRTRGGTLDDLRKGGRRLNHAILVKEMTLSDFLINSAFAALLAFFLLKGWDLFARSKRLNSHRSAISSEIEICHEDAATFLKAEILAPSYRLPCITYGSNLPQLLSNGALDRSEIHGLIRFFNQVEPLKKRINVLEG